MFKSNMYGILTIFFCVSSLGHISKENDPHVQKLHGKTYQLMYNAQKWNEARDSCAKNEGKLAVPDSEEEFIFIQKMVRGIHYPSIVNADFKLMVWLGISNLENYLMWKTVDDVNLDDIGFHAWAGENGQPFSNDPAEPHCVGMDAQNYGLRDYWCSMKLAYICELLA